MIDDQKEIESLLARRIGLDPTSTGPHVIGVAVRRRMADLGLRDVSEYAAMASGSESEQQALIEEVVVPESWFFRDDRPFRWLSDRVREGWVGRPGRPAFRALSIPCAGGQEPYSIAIALLDAGLPARRFWVDAVDVSARSLEMARRGVYSANAFRGEGEWRRHFRPHARGFELDPAIRSTVQFVQGNALDPKLLAGSDPYDVVFCRNLLIYLDRPSRARVLSTLDRLVADDGVLFLGHADRIDEPDQAPRFVPTGESGCFCHRRATHLNVPPAPLSIPMLAGRMLPEPPPLRMLPVSEPAAPSPPSPPRSPMDEAAELANLGRYDEAIAACERQIHRKGPDAAVYYLMGMIRQAAGDRRAAEDCFHKTLYLDPRHDEALLALALLADRRGDHAAAAGYRRRLSGVSRP